MDPFIWSLLNILLLIIIMAVIFAYFRRESNYRKQLLDKMDSLIRLLEGQKIND